MKGTTAATKVRNTNYTPPPVATRIAAPTQAKSSPYIQLKKLQTSLGNRNIHQLHSTGVLQAKLNIGKSDDKYEKEADGIASDVENISGASEPISISDSQADTPLAQRQEDREDEKPEAKPDEKQDQNKEAPAKKEGEPKAKSKAKPGDQPAAGDPSKAPTADGKRPVVIAKKIKAPAAPKVPAAKPTLKGEKEPPPKEEDKKEEEKPKAKKSDEPPSEGSGGGIPRTKPKKKTVTDPDKDPAFQSVVGGVGAAGKTLKAHEPATAKSAQAQEAAKGPPDEVEGKAQVNQVGEMEKAKPKTFDKAAFKKALIDRIKAIAPKNMVETLAFKASGKLDSAKRTMTKQVKKGKQDSASDISGKTEAKPQTKGIKPKAVTPLKPEKEIQKPQIPGQEGAAPKAKTDEEISLEAESKSLDKKMEEAKVTEEQLEKSNEPEFKKALKSKRTAQASARKAPGKFRAQEKVILAASVNIAKDSISKDVDAMQAKRNQTSGKVMGKQVGGQGKDETERAKVTRDIKTIFNQTKLKVETILSALDTKVETKFDTGASAAQKTFEDYVDDKMTAYKEDRYSGIGGAIAWAWDKLTGMPDEVNVFYSEGRVIFLEEMDRAIDDVTDLIADELKKAGKAIIEGKKKIAKYVKDLPDALKKHGKEAADEIQDEFDILEQEVASKQDELINTLAQKYVDNVKKVDEKIKKMKEANRGLIAKAFDFIVGVIKAIIEIGKKLLSLLVKIASVVWDIISDPIGFLGNLIDAIKLGFNNFKERIWEHLKKGVIVWLTGSMGGMNIEIPEKFDLPGIFKLVLSVLGITWANIRAKAVKMYGETVVQAMEKGSEIIQVIKKDGAAGLWKYLKQEFSDLKVVVLDAIKEMLITQVIKAGIKWVLGLFNPVGAFIKAAMMIYEVVKFFIENAKLIEDLINSIFDAIGAIAKGSIGQAAKKVENALAKTIPLIIGLLASLLGISGLAKKVQKLIKRVRRRIDRAITKLLKKVKKAFKGLMKKAGKALGMDKKQKEQVEKKLAEKDDEKETKDDKPKDLSGYSVEKILKMPPASRTRSAPHKATDLKNAKMVVGKIITKSKTTSDVQKYFPRVKRRFALKKIGYVNMGKGASSIEILLNPKANIDVGGNLIWEDDPGGVKHETKVTFGGLDSKTRAATSMVANPLSPDHPQGGPPKPGAISYIMDQLVTDRNQRNHSKYIRGHLLNDNVGGPGVDKNLFPITAKANSKHHWQAENQVKKWVNKDRFLVFYSVKVTGIDVDIVKPNTKDPRNKVNANFECEAWPLNADSKPAPGGFKTTIASRYQAPAEVTKEEVEGTGKATESKYEGDVEESTSKKKKS